MGRDHVLRHGPESAVVAVEPGGEARVVDVGDVVALRGFGAVVVNDGEKFILPLTRSILVPETKTMCHWIFITYSAHLSTSSEFQSIEYHDVISNLGWH